MIRSKLGLKALGMCALVLGLMAVWAGAAQAEEPGGSWTYETSGGVLKTFEGALAEPEIGGEIEAGTVGILHAEALEGTKVLYECKSFTVAAGSKLKPNGIALGKLVFHECKTFLNGTESKPCEPKAGSSPGLIVTNLIKAQMLLHKLFNAKKELIGTDKILIAEGETEAGVLTHFGFIESSESCALGKKVLVGGTFAIEPSNPSTHEVKHLIKEFAPLTHLWILSDNTEHKATILGSAWAFLRNNEHTGLKFAGLWL